MVERQLAQQASLEADIAEGIVPFLLSGLYFRDVLDMRKLAHSAQVLRVDADPTRTSGWQRSNTAASDDQIILFFLVKLRRASVALPGVLVSHGGCVPRVSSLRCRRQGRLCRDRRSRGHLLL